MLIRSDVRLKRDATATSLAEHLVYEGDRDRSLADSRRDTLHVSASYVADGEHPRQARLEQMRRPAERPVRGREVVGRQVRSGLDEALGVERHTAVQPAGGGIRTRHEEHVPDRLRLGLSAARVAPGHALEMIATFQRHDLRERPHADARAVLDAAYEVPRHRVRER